jgi:hypothetical protein
MGRTRVRRLPEMLYRCGCSRKVTSGSCEQNHRVNIGRGFRLGCLGFAAPLWRVTQTSTRLRCYSRSPKLVLFGIQKGAQLDEKVQVLVSNQLHGEICYFVLSFHSNKHLLQCVQARGISASASQQLSNWTRNTVFSCFQHLTAIGVNPCI